MACSTCPPAKTPKPAPLPAPQPPPDCAGSEPCVELVDAACVVYKGSALAQTGVISGERLAGILKKIDDLLGRSGGSVFIRSTTTVSLSGTGSATVPFRPKAVVAPLASNLLKATSDGLLVQFGVAQARDLLQLIKSTPELKALFCNICDVPAPPLVCQSLILSLTDLAAPDTVLVGTYMVNLSWARPLPVSATVDAYLVLVQVRLKYDQSSVWGTVESLDKTYSQRLLTGFSHNTVVQFKLVNQCGENSTSDSNIVEACYVAPLKVAAFTVAPTTTTMTFAHQGADTDAYEVTLLTSTRNVISTTVLALPFPTTVTHQFTGLIPTTGYIVQVVSRVDAYRSTVFEDTFSTPANPCQPVTNLTVTIV